MLLRTLRLVMVYFLSFLLGFEPAALAGKQSVNWKQILDESGLGKKDLKLRDFYAKNKQMFPHILQQEMEHVLSQDPDIMLPQFDFDKLPGKDGNEDLKVSYTVDGKSVSMTFVAADQTAHVGGEKITTDDWLDGVAAIEKLEKATKSGVVLGTIVNKGDFNLRLMHFDDLKKMPNVQQKAYLDQLREILRYAQRISPLKRTKTAAAALPTNWLMSMLMETADAAYTEGGQCLIAGYLAVYKKNADGNLECGYGEQAADVKTHLQCAANVTAEANVKCNGGLYGFSTTTPTPIEHCVPRANATAECEKRGKDWKPQTKKDWEDYKAQFSQILKFSATECGVLEQNVGKSKDATFESLRNPSLTAADHGKLTSAYDAEVSAVSDCRNTHVRIDRFNRLFDAKYTCNCELDPKKTTDAVSTATSPAPAAVTAPPVVPALVPAGTTAQPTVAGSAVAPPVAPAVVPAVVPAATTVQPAVAGSVVAPAVAPAVPPASTTAQLATGTGSIAPTDSHPASPICKDTPGRDQKEVDKAKAEDKKTEMAAVDKKKAGTKDAKPKAKSSFLTKWLPLIGAFVLGGLLGALLFGIFKKKSTSSTSGNPVTVPDPNRLNLLPTSKFKGTGAK